MQFFPFVAARADTGAVLPYGKATVYLTGTMQLAVLFDQDGNGIANPLTCDVQGAGGFAAANGVYDIAITSADGGYSVPLIPGVQLYDMSELDATVAAVNAAAARATGKKADLFVIFGQSLTVGRAPQVTLAGGVVPTLFSFSGGSETENLTDPVPLNSQTLPVDPHNYAAIIPFAPRIGFEGWGPGLGYQSKLAGADGCFFFVPGRGSMSIKQLHFAHIINFQHGLVRAVKLLRAAGYEPTVYLVFDQGHADADALDDGNNSTTPTSHDDYLVAARKLFATMQFSASVALGYAFTGSIWVVPLLTQNTVASLDARRAISDAQADMPGLIPNVRLLPPRSQFANIFATDLTHPVGQGYRYFAELVAAYLRSGLTPPRMVSKVLAAGKVTVTFDQPIKFGSVPDATTPGNSKDGFTIIDNTGAEVAVTATALSGTTITLTPASTANLSGSWFVRNGLQMLGTEGTTGNPVALMPRTRAVGAVDAGTAQDGTVLQNSSIPQEI